MTVEAAAGVSHELTAPGQPFEVVQETVRGSTMRVWRNAPETLPALLSSSREWGERDYLVHGSQRFSYERHARAAASLGHHLVAEMGVRKGDRIAIASSNRISWSVAFWGASTAGAVIVPLNSWGTGEELDYAISDSGSTLLFADSARLARLGGRLNGIDVITLDEPVDFGGAKSVRHWTTLVDSDTEFSLPAVQIDTDDDATIFYTSGTTGRPKGAVGTHRNMTTNVMNLLYWGAEAEKVAQVSGIKSPIPPSVEQSSTLVTVPLFHATGCHATLVAATTQGAKLVLLNKFDPAAAVDLIERERLTRIIGVPTTIESIIDAGRGRDLSSVNYVGYGGAPASSGLIDRIGKAMPNASFGVGYGLTESSANATTNIGSAYEGNPTSVGRPCPVIEVKIIDKDGHTVPPGVVGEIVLSGPNIVRGYWNQPEETAKTFSDGGLRTGDLGKVDDDGNLYVCDRIKDIVIRGGENVYCAEIEHILCEDPQILEAAIIGRPHPVLGEEVVAIVRLYANVTREEFDCEEALRRVGQRLASFKVPSAVEIDDQPLPRTATGKIQKDRLRKRFGRSTTNAAAGTSEDRAV